MMPWLHAVFAFTCRYNVLLNSYEELKSVNRKLATSLEISQLTLQSQIQATTMLQQQHASLLASSRVGKVQYTALDTTDYSRATSSSQLASVLSRPNSSTTSKPISSFTELEFVAARPEDTVPALHSILKRERIREEDR